MRRIPAVVFALALLAAPMAFAGEQLRGRIADDSTYGEGGTKETFVGVLNELRAEVWRDKDGIVREQHEIDIGGDELWGFFVGEGTATYNWGGAIQIKPIGGPVGAYTMTIYGTGNVTIKEYGFLTKVELDTEFEHWHTQMRGWINGFLRAQQGNG